jgi:hypothetical protein
VVQLCCQEKKSGCLLLYNGKNKIGEIFLKSGEVIAARMSNIKGEKAFYKLISLEKGEFSFENTVRLPEREIDVPCEYLFLETARHKDEIKNYLERIGGKLIGKTDKVEEALFFEEIYNLVSKTGQLLEGGKTECLWSKEDSHFCLFLETNKSILKIILLPHAGLLEELISQIKEIVKEE